MSRALSCLLIAVLIALAPRAASADAPTVVSTNPKSGQEDVDPKLAEFIVVFDQPMSNKGWSVVGGGPNFPDLLGKGTWTDDHTLVWKWQLQPGHDYVMGFNSPRFLNFRNTAGEPSVPYTLAFRTAGSGAASQPTDVPSPMTAAQWTADLDTLVTQLSAKHVDPFFHITKEQFGAQAADLRKRIPDLTEPQIMLGFQRLVASIGDAHTDVGLGSRAAELHLLPFLATPLADGVLITSATPAHADLNGCELLRIGDVPVQDAIDRVAVLYSWENTAWKLEQVPPVLSTTEALQAAGIIAPFGEPAATVTLRRPDGTDSTVTLVALPATGQLLRMAPLRRPTTGPAIVSGQFRRASYWLADIPDAPAKMLYLRYDRCADDPGHTVAQFAAELGHHLDQFPPDRVIVDLRHNASGNSALFAPVVTALTRPALSRPGSIILLIGHHTFSSGQMAAEDLRSATHCVVMGSPTGQKPNCHGEVQSFTLPKSQLIVFYSIKKFTTEPGDPASMMPDVTVESMMDDYRAGRDVVLERAIAYHTN